MDPASVHEVLQLNLFCKTAPNVKLDWAAQRRPMDVPQNQEAAQPPTVLSWPSRYGGQRSQHTASGTPWQASVTLSVYKPAGLPAPCHSTCVHGQHSQHLVQLQSQVQQQALPP